MSQAQAVPHEVIYVIVVDGSHKEFRETCPSRGAAERRRHELRVQHGSAWACGFVKRSRNEHHRNDETP